MGRKIKAGKKGEASQYLTRSNAIRKLQLSLQDFRRVCILKGVYPREPRKKFKGNTKTYFHTKDIKILEHDNLIEKFREIKAHLKKHKKYLGRREVKIAENHMTNKPKYSLGPIIKDRYPTFVDALRDLDDALCMVAMFAQLPQHMQLEIQKDTLETCNKLYREFLFYCMIAQNFTKAFFSIKGVYYRVEIMGQPVTWIAPYKFNQRTPFDVDFKVMGTFTEFYIALLRFINFKLFTDLGMAYPQEIPLVNETFYDCDKVRSLQKVAREKFGITEDAVVDETFADTPEMQALNERMNRVRTQKRLFADCLFSINREAPVYILQHLILSFGGAFVIQDVIDDLDEAESAKVYKKVTHIVMDRPLPPAKAAAHKSKELIQPQYLLDSLNNLLLLPTRPYKPGVPAPPHLSPFVDNESAGYIPDRQREINTLAGVATPAVNEEESESEEQESDNEEEVEMKGDADSSSEEEVVEKEEKKPKKASASKLKKDLEEEARELGKMVMTKRQRKLYQEADKE